MLSRSEIIDLRNRICSMTEIEDIILQELVWYGRIDLIFLRLENESSDDTENESSDDSDTKNENDIKSEGEQHTTVSDFFVEHKWNTVEFRCIKSNYVFNKEEFESVRNLFINEGYIIEKYPPSSYGTDFYISLESD